MNLKKAIYVLVLLLSNFDALPQVRENKSKLINEMHSFLSYVDSVKGKSRQIIYYLNFLPNDSCENEMSFSVKYIRNIYEKKTLTGYSEVITVNNNIVVVKRDDNTPDWAVFDTLNDFFQKKIDDSFENGVYYYDDSRLEYIYSGCSIDKRIVRLCCDARFEAPDIKIK